MAERKENPFSQALHAAAKMVPIGIGAHQSWKSLQRAGGFAAIRPGFSQVVSNQGSNAITNQINTVLQDTIQSGSLTRKGRVGQLESILDKVADVTQRETTGAGLPGDLFARYQKNFSRDAVIDAWKNALTNSGVSAGVAEELTARVSSMSDVTAALSDIKSVVTGTDSIYIQRAFSTFMDDVGIIERRAFEGMPTSFVNTGFSKESLRDLRSINKGVAITDPVMKSHLAKMSEALGAGFEATRFSRADMPGSELVVTWEGGKLGRGKRGPNQLSITIPESISPGVHVRGGTQQSKYITGMYGVIDPKGALKNTYTYEQFTTYRALEDILPALMNEKRLTRSKIHGIQSAFERQMMGMADWVETLPTVGRGGRDNEAIDQYIEHRSKIMRLYGEGGSQYGDRGFVTPTIDELMYSKIIEQRKLGNYDVFPSSSPASIARNIVATQDPRSMYLFPNAVPFERRPLQPLRKASLTQGARQAIDQHNLLQRNFGWAAWGSGVEAPMTRTTYVSERYAEELARIGMGTQGGMMIDEAMASQFAFTRPRQININPEQAGEGIKELLERQQAGEGGTLRVGKGFNYGRGIEGSIVEAERGGTILSARGHWDKQKGSYITLTVAEEIENPQWAKFFGDAKALAAFVEKKKIQGSLSSLGAPAAQIDLGTQAMVAMGELKKNRAIHYRQLFTELWNFTAARGASGMQFASPLGRGFWQRPSAVIAGINKAALRNDKFAHEVVIQKAMKLARATGLNPAEMGSVFGAVPDVFGMDLWADEEGLQKEWTQRFGSSISREEASAISKGFASGVMQFFSEDIGAGYAGIKATIEPRMFELLGSPNWGTLGGELQEDFALRMISANEFRTKEQEAFGKAVESFLHPGKIEGALLPSQLGGVAEGTVEGGYALSLPGIGDVHMPGKGMYSSLAEFRTPAGDWVKSDLNYKVEHFMSQAEEYEAGNLSKEAMKEEMELLQTSFQQARIGTVTGGGGLLRGKLPGSRFLTGVPASLPGYGIVGAGEAGITAKYASGLFTELEDITAEQGHLGEIAELQAQKKAFLASKGKMTIPGIVGRHPATSPFSLQSINYRLVPGDDAVIAFNEMETRAVISRGQASADEMAIMVRATKDLRSKENRTLLRNAGMEVVEGMRFSPMVGMMGDTDADAYAAIFVRPGLQKKLAGQLTTNQDEYIIDSIRQQLLKGKAAQGKEITLAQEAASGALQLGIPQRGRLGKVSVRLQTARAAILSQQKRLGPERVMNALGAITAAEQLPIGAKHIAKGESYRMIDLIDQMTGSMERKQDTKFAKVFENIFAAPGQETRRAILNEGITIATPGSKPQYIPPVGIGRASTDIMESMTSFENSKVGGIGSDRLRNLLYGRGTPSRAESEALMSQAGINTSPIGGLLKPSRLQPTSGTMSKLTSRMSALRNEAARVGKNILPHVKPLALGFGAAIALSSILSTPQMSMDPESLRPPQPSMRGNSGGADQPTNIHPEEHVTGTPTTGGIGASPKAYISSNRAQAINIRGRSAGGTHYGNMSRQMTSVVGGNSRTSTSVNDNRYSLGPHHISNIIKNK